MHKRNRKRRSERKPPHHIYFRDMDSVVFSEHKLTKSFNTEVLNRWRTLDERLYCSHLQGVFVMAKYRKYSSEFKLQAAKLVQNKSIPTKKQRNDLAPQAFRFAIGN